MHNNSTMSDVLGKINKNVNYIGTHLKTYSCFLTELSSHVLSASSQSRKHMTPAGKRQLKYCQKWTEDSTIIYMWNNNSLTCGNGIRRI